MRHTHPGARVARVAVVLASGAALALLVFVPLAACGGGSGSPFNSFLPTRVSASWTGGALGPPNDRRDEEATEWVGQLCPATHLKLDYNGVTLNFKNKCTIPVTYGICVTAGTLQGANVCAPDPFDTPMSSMLLATILPGDIGDFRNASGNLAVNFFYCSDRDQLTGGPVRCLSVR